MRWKAFIPTVIILGLVFVCVTFFLDGWVERAIEKTGTAVNGAKVELDGADVSLLHLDVALRRLQVTDENNPMTNALEVEALRFGLAAKPLTWKKIIIENAEISGIRTGTPRKTSGALPKKAKEEKPSKMVEAGKEAAQFVMANLKEQYDPKKMVQLDDLASYKKIQEEKARLPTVAQGWQSRVEQMNVEEKAKEAQSLAQKIQTEKFSGLERIQKAKQMLDQARQVREDLQRVQKEFTDLKTQVKSEMAQTKATLNQINDLQKQDVDNFLGKLKADFSTEGLLRGLVGPQWYAKIQTGLGWFHKARRMIPQKKEEAAPPPPVKRTGRVIHFPFRYNWPAFQLVKAGVSGTTSGENPLSYKGTLTDVTSDPSKVGRPIALDIRGEKGSQRLAFKGELDYTRDTPREKVSLTYQGLSLDGKKLGDAGGPVSIKEGKGVVTANLEARAEKIDGTIEFVADPVRLQHDLSADQARNRLLGLLHEVLVKLNRMDVTFLVSDTITSPNFKVKSSLDNQLNQAVKQTLQKEVDELRAQFQTRVNELVSSEKAKLTELANGQISAVTEKLDKKEQVLQSAEGQVQKALDDLKKKAQESVPIPLPGGKSGESNGSSVPNLKNIFKKK